MGEGEARGEGKGGAKEELPPMETNMYREACTICFTLITQILLLPCIL